MGLRASPHSDDVTVVAISTTHATEAYLP